jgi:hypothetical protein
MMSHPRGSGINCRLHVTVTLRHDTLGFYWQSEDGEITVPRHRNGDDALDEILAIWLDDSGGQGNSMEDGQAEVA